MKKYIARQINLLIIDSLLWCKSDDDIELTLRCQVPGARESEREGRDGSSVSVATRQQETPDTARALRSPIRDPHQVITRTINQKQSQL